MGIQLTDANVVIGCDVGKASHQFHLTDRTLETLGRKRVANTYADIDAALGWAATFGAPVLVIDQKASLAAMLRLAAAARDVPVLYVSGLQARRASDLTPGRAKTDRIDAEVIGTFGVTHARNLPLLTMSTELDTKLRLLLGRDEDLRCDFNRTINRLRDLLTNYSPNLEATLGRRVVASGVLAALTRWSNPADLARARTTTIAKTIAAHNPRLAAKTATLMRDAAQSTPPQAGLSTAGEIIGDLAAAAISIKVRRSELETELTELAQQHDDYELLRTIAGFGAKNTVVFIAEIGDISRFPTAGHLASYAGLAPVNRQSGTGLNTVHKDRAGNHRLKNALFLAAFVATRHDPHAAHHYKQQRERGKHHNAAIIATARKRCDIIYAILTNRTPYQPLTT